MVGERTIAWLDAVICADMSIPDPGEITRLLKVWSGGDASALDRLLDLVHDRLHRLAGSFMNRERSQHTLQTTELVNEAYLRLVRQDQVQWRDQVHFFAIAGKVMRRILVDHARRNTQAKRGGKAQWLPLEKAEWMPVKRARELVELDEALKTLEAREAELAWVVELKYFGGLIKEEIAEVMGLSPATVTRRYRAARAWLYFYLVEEANDECL